VLATGILETSMDIKELSDVPDIHLNRYDTELYMLGISDCDFVKALGGRIVDVLRELKALRLSKDNVEYLVYFSEDNNIDKYLDACIGAVDKDKTTNQIDVSKHLFKPGIRIIATQYEHTIRDMVKTIFETATFANENE
jgi:hypothetical protein